MAQYINNNKLFSTNIKEDNQKEISNHILISNVEEYLKALKANKLRSFYSRGENSKYPSIDSKAYRNNYVYENAIKEFSKSVYKDLSEIQKEHFLAFCQHYGLPTNLVDFTKSPLVSLFFACLSEKEQKDNGYIYFIDSRTTQDITDLIRKDIFIDIKKLFYEIEHDSGRQKNYLDFIASLFEENNHLLPIEFSSSNTIERIKNNDKNLFYELAKYYKHKSDYFCDGEEAKYIFDNWQKLIENSNLTYLTYLMLIGVLNISNFTLPILYTYSPPEIINRMTVQHSIFVYQFSRKKGSHKQMIKPNFTIEIVGEKKKEILQDLDYLGINIKTIFGDYDSIAKYIMANTDVWL